MDLGLGSFLGGVASGISSAVSSRNALKAQRETNEMNYKIWGEQQQHNIDMFNMQNQANIDMWNMQNEYNDPSAQIQRLSAAGLNPYLAMGNNPSGVATNAPAAGTMNPSNPPTMQAPGVEAFDLGIGQAVDRIMNGLAIQSQIDLNKTQGDKNTSDSERTRGLLPWEIKNYGSMIGQRDVQNDLLRSQTIGQDLQNRFDRITFDSRVEQQNTLVATMKAQEALMSLNVQEKQIVVNYLGAEKALHLEKTMMEIANGDMDLKMKLGMLRKFNQDIKESNARIGLMDKQGQLMDSQGKYYEAQASFIGVQEEGQKTANDKAKLEYDSFAKSVDSMTQAAIDEALARSSNANLDKFHFDLDYSNENERLLWVGPTFGSVKRSIKYYLDW